MLDLFYQALAIPGLGWLLGAALAAGLVRGFSGFGTALIFIPVAAQVVDPVQAVIVLVVMEMAGPVPAIAGALKEIHRKDLTRLVLGSVIAVPLGIMALITLDATVFKFVASLVSLVMLAALMAGLRYQGDVTPKLVWFTGAVAGFLGGAVGIPGPPVIMLYMASSHAIRVIRANITVYLFAYAILMLIVFLVMGRLVGLPLAVGILAMIPNLMGNLIGGALFNPKYEGLYRWVAYGVIAASGLSGFYSALG